MGSNQSCCSRPERIRPSYPIVVESDDEKELLTSDTTLTNKLGFPANKKFFKARGKFPMARARTQGGSKLPDSIPPPPMPPPGLAPPPGLGPPPAMGDKSTKPKAEEKKPKFRKVYVDKIELDDQEESFWANQKEEDTLDEEDAKWILDKFKVKSPSQRKDNNTHIDVESFEVLKGQRRQNVSILMRKMGLTPIEAMNALLSADTKILTEENLERFRKMFPNEKEIRDIEKVLKAIKSKLRIKSPGSNFENEKILERLSQEERLMARLYSVPKAKERIEKLLFTYHFYSDYKRADNMLSTLESAVERITTASTDGQLRRLLAVVLRFVNMLNGTENKGFRLSSLGKIASVKMTKGKGSLMDVIVVHCTTIDKEKCGHIDVELADFEQATATNHDELTRIIQGMMARMTSIGERVKELKKEIETSKESETEGSVNAMEDNGSPRDTTKSTSPDEALLNLLTDFYNKKHPILSQLEDRLKKCWKDFESIRKKFHEPEIKMQDFFKIFVAFRMEYIKSKKAMEDKKRRAERRRKEAEMKRNLSQQRRSRRSSMPLANSHTKEGGITTDFGEIKNPEDITQDERGNLVVPGQVERRNTPSPPKQTKKAIDFRKILKGKGQKSKDKGEKGKTARRSAGTFNGGTLESTKGLPLVIGRRRGSVPIYLRKKSSKSPEAPAGQVSRNSETNNLLSSHSNSSAGDNRSVDEEDDIIADLAKTKQGSNRKMTFDNFVRKRFHGSMEISDLMITRIKKNPDLTSNDPPPTS
ncbi:hypothetical protein AAMO2058_000040100 [Amorphochlora amoebiformis]